MYELKYQKSNIRISQIVHIMIQTIPALPCFFPEILKVSQFMNQINPLHCFQNGFGWLKTIGRSISKYQRNPISKKMSVHKELRLLARLYKICSVVVGKLVKVHFCKLAPNISLIFSKHDKSEFRR